MFADYIQILALFAIICSLMPFLSLWYFTWNAHFNKLDFELPFLFNINTMSTKICVEHSYKKLLKLLLSTLDEIAINSSFLFEYAMVYSIL